MKVGKFIRYRFCMFFIMMYMVVSCHVKGKNQQTTQQENNTPTSQHAAIITLPEHGFYCGFVDSKDHLWLGSRGEGVFRYDGQQCIQYTNQNGLCDQDIFCITEDSQGNMWFGTTTGVCRFDGQTFTSLDIPQSDTSTVWLDQVYPVVNPNQVMSILEDNDGKLWFGTNGAGVYQYDNKTFTQHLADLGKRYEDSLYHNIVLSMTKDKKGNIWFSSLSHGGVSKYDGKKFTHYTRELSDDFVRVVFCDTRGNIWIGTHGNQQGGLDLYDGKQFKHFHKTKDGFHNNNVRNIYEDNHQTLWIASGITELATFDGQHFSVFTDDQGKSYDKIIFVTGDKKGNVWFGNKTGLWKYNGRLVTCMTQS